MASSTYQILEHYKKGEVRREIAYFCRKRWVALFGKRVVRYDEKGAPLCIERPNQVIELLKRFSLMEPRSIHATSATFLNLSQREDVESETNVISYTPYWDIDNDRTKWKATVEIAQGILDSLEREGISNSVYVMWTGRGMHVNLNQGSISPEITRKYGALDAAWAIVEYIIEKITDKLQNIREKHKAFELRVDNEIKPKNLFSVPLSLHRKVNSVVICIRPDDLSSFNPSWSNPSFFKHSTDWRIFSIGEADNLVKKAINIYGGYPYPRRRGYRRKEPKVEDMLRKWMKKNNLL